VAAWFRVFGLSSWEALGDISDEDWKVVSASLPRMRPDHPQDFEDHSRLGPGHWGSLCDLRDEAIIAKELRLSWERRLRKEGRLRFRTERRERRMREAGSTVTEAGSSIIVTVGSEGIVDHCDCEPGWDIVGDVGSEEPGWEIVGDV
jgi:hypothetical protein